MYELGLVAPYWVIVPKKEACSLVPVNKTLKSATQGGY